MTRGLFIGDDRECFERAAELSIQVNFTVLDEELHKVVVYLDPEEFHSTWLGNKAIYRTRMAIADGGELIVLAPDVRTFGEDPRDRPADPQVRLSDHARDHAVHARERGFAEQSVRGGAPDPRLVREPLPRHLLSRTAVPRRNRRRRLPVRRAGRGAQQRYDPRQLQDGWNTLPDGERVFFIRNPALGLWAYEGRLR